MNTSGRPPSGCALRAPTSLLVTLSLDSKMSFFSSGVHLRGRTKGYDSMADMLEA